MLFFSIVEESTAKRFEFSGLPDSYQLAQLINVDIELKGK